MRRRLATLCIPTRPGGLFRGIILHNRIGLWRRVTKLVFAQAH